MAEAKPQAATEQDPSMEEILQSIRRIIAEEEKTPNGQDTEISSDVLELTQVVREDGSPETLPEAEAAAAAAPVDVLATIEDALSEDILDQEIPLAPPPAMDIPKETPVVAPESQTLISDMAARETTAAFRKLASVPHAPHPTPDALPFRSGLTVEDLVIELLRPLLKEWLDTHLPPLVERIVEREVRRLSGE